MLITIQVPGPRLLVAKEIHLGATFTPNFRSLASNKGILTWRPFSFLRDSAVSFEGILLPDPALKTSIARSIQPVSGIRPFSVTASSTIKHSLFETPPALDIQVSKQVAQRKIAFWSWSSGSWGWPEFLFQRLVFLGMSPDTLFATEEEHSNFQIGLISLPESSGKAHDVDDEEDDEEDEYRQLLQKKRAASRTAETWQTFLQVSPGGGAIVLKYGRNLFSGKPTDDPIKSEWSGEGYFPMPRMEEARGVRLDVSSVISHDLKPSWTVKGTRRVGEYTTVGLGVGIAHTGVHMTVSWNRLGQGFNIPIVLCPANEANQDAAVFATLAPWLAYCAIEFGYIRPRDRKNRRQAAARRHNELKKLIPQKRAESQEAIELMADQVQRRQAREARQDGLVITKAEYGYVPSTSKKLRAKFPESRLIDVTIPVAAMVDQGQLGIPSNTVKVSVLPSFNPLLYANLSTLVPHHGIPRPCTFVTKATKSLVHVPGSRSFRGCW